MAAPALARVPEPSVTRNDTRSRFRPDIEGLRGIAVLLVVAFHAGITGASGGFIGVDVFFVLSGYLITGVLVAEEQRTHKIDVIGFYARRVCRLLPASALVLLTTMGVGMLVLSPLEQTRFARTALAAALNVSNIWFARQANDYFAPEVESNPLLHTWSLSVEEQFYVFWPILIMLVLRINRSRRMLIATMATVVALSFIGATWLTQTNAVWAFFGSPVRAWEFGAGGLASMIPAMLLRGHRACAQSIGWVGIAAVLSSAVLYDHQTTFPGFTALIPALGTVAILVGGVGAPERGVCRVLHARILQRLGQLSYSWYLWHWPVLVIAAALIPSLSLAARIICAFASLGIAALTYRFVESPVRHNSYLQRRPVLSVSFAIVLTAITAVAALGWHQAGLQASASSEQKRVFQAALDYSLPPDIGCTPKFQHTNVQECVFGSPHSPATVVLFGDSHAENWLAGLELVAKEHNWRLVTLIKHGCPAADVPVYNRVIRGIDVSCPEWREAALRRISALRPNAVVVGSASKLAVTAATDAQESSIQRWHDGTRRTLRKISTVTGRVVLLMDTPRPGFDVPTCLSRVAEHTWLPRNVCSVNRHQAVNAEVAQAEDVATRGLHNVLRVDFTDSFCMGELCVPARDGVVIYRDKDHITGAYSRHLAPVLSQLLVPLISPAIVTAKL
jgi:peptidoglycan/LPS O-acetylase OafA/YrhL